MKHATLILAAILCLFLPPSSLWAAPTTAGDAETVVKGWLKLDPQPLGASLGQEVAKVQTFTNDQSEAVYYVVSLQPTGFVIVPADDLVEPIVAFADKGIYDPSPDNPVGALVSLDVPLRVLRVRASNGTLHVAEQTRTASNQAKWNMLRDLSVRDEGGIAIAGRTSVSDVWVAPLTQTKWDQETPNHDCYDRFTPKNYRAGCIATAMAQLMRYHQWPVEQIGMKEYLIRVDGSATTGYYTRGGNDWGGPYNWSQMVYELDINTTDSQRQAIGALCYDAGIASHSSYASDGTGATVDEANYALVNTFHYANGIVGSNSNSSEWPGLYAMVNCNLDAGYPVILGLVRTGGRHAALADGYGYQVSTLYHHLNVGWSGSGDAWYELPTVDTDPPDRVYTIIPACIYNIFPTGKGEIISGRVTTSAPSPISGARVTASLGAGLGSWSATTNDKGIYALVGLNARSTYVISVEKAGYSFASRTLRVGASVDGNDVSGNKWGVNFVNTVAYSPILVDDMEDYTDQHGRRIFDVWIDGGTNGTGSVVGYDTSPFAEVAVLHGGRQSLPMGYNNAYTPFYSEINRVFSPLQNWTSNGVTDLSLWVRGSPVAPRVAVTETGGKMSLTGAGADIWGTSDQFVYAYKVLTSYGSIVARVVSVGTGSNMWAKGGVMIRDSLDSGSAHAMQIVTGGAGNGASFQWRQAADWYASASDPTTTVAPPYWVKIERAGDTLTGSVSADGVTWSRQGVPQTIAMTGPVYLGICVTSHAAGEPRTFQFDNIRTTGTVSGSWQGAEIGGASAVTSVAVTETGGKMSLTGDGVDIWYDSDQFVYAYKTLTGDGAMVARVTSNGTGSNTWAKGGVMIRDGLDGRSAHAMQIITGGAGNGANFQWRPATNGYSWNSDPPMTVAPPYWVKIERVGNVLTGFLSADGVTWRPQGVPQTIMMTAPVYIGLCVTSHAAGELRTFQFDNIRTTGGVSGTWQGVEIASPRYNSVQPLYVAVEDSAGRSGVATNATAVNAAAWTEWTIPLSSFTGVNLANVKKLYIGVGSKNTSVAGGEGLIYLDDIWVIKR